MTVFISTDRGHINLDSVVMVRREKQAADGAGKPVYSTRVYYRDEYGEPQQTWSTSDPESLGTSVVPAAPGYFLIGVWCDQGKHCIWREPIVAWRLEFDCNTAHPVGFSYGDGNPHILTPDGQVVIPEDRTFDTVDAYLADYVAKTQAENAKAKCATV